MTELLRELEAVVHKMQHIKDQGWNVDLTELSDTRVACIDFVNDYHAEIAEAVKLAAIGREYLRWYGAAKGHRVIADSAHETIMHNSAREVGE